MLDGSYSAKMNTPMGAITGKLSLQCQGNRVEGMLEIMGMKQSFQGTKIKENTCGFQGNLNTPLGNINYDATCTVNGNEMELVAKTGKGNFTIVGNRV